MIRHLTHMNLLFMSLDSDIPSIFESKQNFAKYTFYGCGILKLCFWRCDGLERHQMLAVICNYYSYKKYFKFGIFCTNPV